MRKVTRLLVSLSSLFAALLAAGPVSAGGIGHYPGGEVQWEYLYQDGQVREAKWYDEQGRLTTRALYQDNRQSLSEGYRSDGSLAWRALNLADGRQEITRFDAGRRMVIRYQAKAGQADGTSTVFHPGGQPRQSVTFRAGVPHGPAQTFYENGQVEREYAFVEGQLDGVCRLFSPEGRLLVEQRFEKGREEE
jgi:antitoxin component YwqK of YwqJK toxin-antitoxin module